LKPIYSIYAGSNGSINWRIHRGSDINRRTHSGVLQTTPGRLELLDPSLLGFGDTNSSKEKERTSIQVQRFCKKRAAHI